MKRLLWTLTFSLMGLAILASGGADNPTFTPAWHVGDVFHIEYHKAMFRQPKQPGGLLRGPDDVFNVRYEVIEKKKSEAGKTQVVIKAIVPVTLLIKDEFRLVFEEDPLVLVERVQINRGPGRSNDVTTNPFGTDSWMFELFPGRFIVDFPRLPPTNTNETRAIDIPSHASASLPFAQKVTFTDAKTVNVEMSRTAYDDSHHVSTQTWEAHKKWWSTAEIDRNGEYMIKGHLLEGKEDAEAARKEQEDEKKAKEEEEQERKEQGSEDEGKDKEAPQAPDHE